MTPLDLDAAKARANDEIYRHSRHCRGWESAASIPDCSCNEVARARDVLALADEVGRLTKRDEAQCKAIYNLSVEVRHLMRLPGAHGTPLYKVLGLTPEGVERRIRDDIDPQPPAPPEELKADVWTVGPPLTYEQAKAWCDAQGLPAPAPPDPGRQSADGDPEGYGDPAPLSQKEPTCRCGYPERLHGCPGFACELFEAARPAAPEVDK